ncbi:DUF1697 domain-containing protein [Rhodobacterales bacterium HKCCE3408]|nr:DUF1697 domain-containing protein [Rhodobacterales bacterium HKCCE3408]
MRVLLLRGVNVGGHGKLPMGELRAILKALGAQDVATYIQSGNAVFRGDLTATEISAAIEDAMGFRPHALVLPAETLAAVIAANPFAEALQTNDRAVHAWFCDGPPAPLSDEIRALAGPSEDVAVSGDVCYLLAPDGIGRSKLAERLERALEVPATARNWRTVRALAAMAGLE